MSDVEKNWTTPSGPDGFVINESLPFCGMMWEALDSNDVHVCFLDEGHPGPCVCGACDHKDEHGNAYKHGTYYGKLCP